MQLDALTLMVPGSLALIFAGVFLVRASLHFKTEPALKWWAAAHGINGIGLAFLIYGVAFKSTPAVVAGSGFMTSSPALIWGGFRRFAGQSVSPVLLGAGMFLWALPVLARPAIDTEQWMILSSFLVWFVYLTAAVWTLYRAEDVAAGAHRSLMALLFIHGVLYLAGAYQVLSGTFPHDKAPAVNSIFGMIHFETILFTMGTTIFMLLVCKERIDGQYREAAKIDALTGAVNRGTLCENSQRLLDRCRAANQPISLILFDLDHFKLINDTHGHLAGDQILRSFADTVRSVLRPNDLFGRYGGEEFMVVLAETPVESACFVAERVRFAFANGHRLLDGKEINATVSAGVAGVDDGQGKVQFETLIREADKALYLAKNGGRNRVERAIDEPPDELRKLFRIA